MFSALANCDLLLSVSSRRFLLVCTGCRLGVAERFRLLCLCSDLRSSRGFSLEIARLRNWHQVQDTTPDIPPPAARALRPCYRLAITSWFDHAILFIVLINVFFIIFEVSRNVCAIVPTLFCCRFARQLSISLTQVVEEERLCYEKFVAKYGEQFHAFNCVFISFYVFEAVVKVSSGELVSRSPESQSGQRKHLSQGSFHKDHVSLPSFIQILGLRLWYFKSLWNWFDLIILFLAIIDMVLDLTILHGAISKSCTAETGVISEWQGMEKTSSGLSDAWYVFLFFCVNFTKMAMSQKLSIVKQFQGHKTKELHWRKILLMYLLHRK